MTEKLQQLPTHIATLGQAVVSPTSHISSPDVPHKAEVPEEEPYTIKCICNFCDDDGNTIFCETCESWQHIQCYYPEKIEIALREDFPHSCVECDPRPLDKQEAVERQKSRKSAMVVPEAQDRKTKRSQSKPQKKKVKPTDLQLKGQPNGNDMLKHNSPHEQLHPPKKLKSSHKANHSVSSQAQISKQSPSHGVSRVNPNGHPPSPATTPPDHPIDFDAHYQDVQISHTNTFANLETAETMPVWPRDPERMRKDTGCAFKDVFQVPEANMKSNQVSLVVESKEFRISPNDRPFPLRYLTTPSALEKEVPLMELNAQVGLQKDYCADPDNRWEDLSSPLPFVFFHPMLPLYLDTRKEGSNARYVRRSCTPNTQLDTFLVGAYDYHFWLVSDRPIAAKEQITLPWDFRFPNKDKARVFRLLGLDEEPTLEDMRDVELQMELVGWLPRILSEYGGCACDRGDDCGFSKFMRNSSEVVQQPLPNAPKRKTRKPKASHTISPTSTGHATNSRAASEGHLDDAPENDGHSASGSSRGKPSSRDMTPARQGSLDAPGILTEPTNREKRKVQMVEDSFRRMEQSQPSRKKKRMFDGTASSITPKAKRRGSTSHTVGLPNETKERAHADAGTFKSKSGSPISATSPNVINTSKHAPSCQTSMSSESRRASSGSQTSSGDAGVQTDPVDDERPKPSKPKRRATSLAKVLMANRHYLKLNEEEKRRKRRESLRSQQSAGNAMDLDKSTGDNKSPQESPLSLQKQTPLIPPGLGASVDTPMPDASSDTATGTNPALTNGVASIAGPVKVQSPDLRLQLPPVPTFSSPTSASATTPISVNGSVVQSLFSASTFASPFASPAVNGITVHASSPAKKKMSLSDWTKRSKVTAARPSSGTTTIKNSSTLRDKPKPASGVDGPALAANSPASEIVATESSANDATRTTLLGTRLNGSM